MATKFTGVVKPYAVDKGFRFVGTDEGDVFVHRKVFGGDAGEYFPLLIPGARVDGMYVKNFDKGSGKFKLEATRIFTISEPVILSGLGYVEVVFKSGEAALVKMISGDAQGQKALLHKSVAIKAGFSLSEGMPIRTTLEEREDGKLAVTAMQSGEEVLAECKAVEVANQAARAAELVDKEVEGQVKSYNPKNYGFVVVDGQDCFVRRETVEAAAIDAALLIPETKVTVKLKEVPKGFEVVEIRLGVAATVTEESQAPAVAEEGEKLKRKLKPKTRKPKPAPGAVTSAGPEGAAAEGPFAALAGFVPQIVGGTEHPNSGADAA